MEKIQYGIKYKMKPTTETIVSFSIYVQFDGLTNHPFKYKQLYNIHKQNHLQKINIEIHTCIVHYKMDSPIDAHL